MIEAGDEVLATQEIAETNFGGHARWVHAAEGDRGLVRAVDGEVATVTWERTGTTTDCDDSEVRRIEERAAG